MVSELQAVISTLNLVETERRKGPAGLSAIVDQADALVIGALEKIVTAPLQNPFAGPAGLTDHLIPARVFRATQDAARREPAPQPIKAGTSTAPLFSKVSAEYIQMRIDADGEDHPDVQYLRLRRQTFLDIVADRPVDRYSPKDLQDYINIMQFWPANTTKRAAFNNLSAKQICDINRSLELKPLARKTLEEGYVANLKTMMRHGMGIYGYQDPFANASLRFPGTLRGSVPRETIGDDVLERAFKAGIESGYLEDALLPLLAYLTGRRIGLLLFLQGADIRKKHGVWIAQTTGIVQTKTGFVRVPVKTSDSLRFFVLHDFLAEIGFIDWARRQTGFIFEAPHEHPDASRYVSKNLNRLLKRNGATGTNVEVLHSLRHGKINEMRSKKVGANQARQQSGHAAAKDEHDKYGSKTEMSAADAKKMATSRLPKTIDWTVFLGLDFDALAAGRRKRGAPIKRHAPSSSNDKTS